MSQWWPARLPGRVTCVSQGLPVHQVGSGPRSWFSWPLPLSPDVSIFETLSINTVVGDACRCESGVYTPR